MKQFFIKINASSQKIQASKVVYATLAMFISGEEKLKGTEHTIGKF